MATSSTADEPRTRADDWQEADPEPSPAVPQPAPAPAAKPVAAHIREEVWQPRYAIVAVIVIILIALQIWILF